VARRGALPRSFFRRDADALARDLIGRVLVRELDGERLVLRIVETEAYLGAGDRASHAFAGRRTERVRAMYLDGGHAYVFFVYGMHHCLNVVAREAGVPQAVLLRAGAAVEGVERMATLRGLRRAPRPGELAGGPGRLCRALAIDRSFDGADLSTGPISAPATSGSGPALRSPTPRSPSGRGSASTTPERLPRGRCASRCEAAGRSPARGPTDPER